MTVFLPTETDIKRIIEQNLNERVQRIERFSTGLCHFVFDVFTETKQNIVLRMTRSEDSSLLKSAVYWNQLLKPKGVPLPEILSFDLWTELPYLILERLPGKDLWEVYPRLSSDQKKELALEMTKLQAIAGTLPRANSFGYLQYYEENTNCMSWSEVIQNSLAKSRTRIKSAGIFESEIVDRVEEKAQNYQNYFSRIRPICFFDEITTQNVIVNNGKLSGIVDVDWMGFGDNLQTVAATRMSLLINDQDLDYIGFWTRAMNLEAERHKVLNFYTAVCCLDFMGDTSQTLNRDVPVNVKEKMRARYLEILENLLKTV